MHELRMADRSSLFVATFRQVKFPTVLKSFWLRFRVDPVRTTSSLVKLLSILLHIRV